ncbi:19358_t:CDS:2, partial [Gigaspora rosea]
MDHNNDQFDAPLLIDPNEDVELNEPGVVLEEEEEPKRKAAVGLKPKKDTNDDECKQDSEDYSDDESEEAHEFFFDETEILQELDVRELKDNDHDKMEELLIGYNEPFILALQEYEFEVVHHPGRQNPNANSLSRFTKPKTKSQNLHICYNCQQR